MADVISTRAPCWSPGFPFRSRHFHPAAFVTARLGATGKAVPPALCLRAQRPLIALLFEKPSLRTRMTFELAIKQLGGEAVSQGEIIGDREPLNYIARNLDRWTDAIVARTFSQHTIDDLAGWSRVPVINALSDLYHPCQALADLFTLREQFGRLKGLKLAYIGDGNNVAHSLLLGCSRLGINISVATPEGDALKAEIVETAKTLAHDTGARIELWIIPWMPWASRTRFIPTFGPKAWGRNRKRRNAGRNSPPTR